MSAEDSRGNEPASNELSEGMNRLQTSDSPPKTDDEYAQSQLTLRAIVTSKEAGVIIGKAGKNVADLRDETGVRAGVSKVVPGVHDRVLTVTGTCDGVSKAYGIVARSLLEGAPTVGMGGVITTNGTHRKLLPFPMSQLFAKVSVSEQGIDLAFAFGVRKLSSLSSSNPPFDLS